ncbi:ThuA domain-containing protein [Solitalea koreensis]|uniref:ThuA-like domain-containing protein n=1 Tax=Solitalea koreensis TaxID=543615 RepID=A0A521ADJ8_9SPHI|nr:ThuA domain-containing protein [Solitalea koreensis]SMO32869.1 hypothetical protein SAMN06265350_10169 [Solitalea koreensis]
MGNLSKLASLCILLTFWACSFTKKTTQLPKILVFSATKGFRHNSIAAGKTALLKMGYENKWHVDTTEDASVFTAANLAQFAAVVFLNTTGGILNDEQQIAFQTYIQAGGGFVGIHSASDTESDWPWYNNLVGACFESHPVPQVAAFTVNDKNHPTVSFMPDTVRRQEEIYNFKSFKKELVNVVLTVEESSYTGGKMPGFHPIAWYHNYDGGKAFYTAWGHAPQAFSEPFFLQHIAEAIKWATIK